MADDYDSLLNDAFEKVKPCEFCDRFEIKKVEGHHEGNKTIITNFGPIATHLRREKDHLARFLFRELASAGEIDGDRLLLNRKMNSQLINEKIEKYVEGYVKCEKCGKPDTELVIESNKNMLKCMACGNKKIVHEI